MDTPAHPQIIVQTENVDVLYAHKKGLMQQLFSTLCREFSWSHLRLVSSATDKESLSVQTECVCETSVPAASDHFRGVTKLIELGNTRRAQGAYKRTGIAAFS